MKALDSPLRLFVLISLILIGISGCNNTVTDPINDKLYPALSEENFVANPNLRAKIGSVIGINLEDVDAPKNDSIPDTDTTGEDVINYRFTENTLYTFRMESSGNYDVRFFDKSTKGWVFYINPINNNVTLNIPAGDYEMHIVSWRNFMYDSASGFQNLFIQPEGVIDPSHFKVLVSSGCKNCDLSGVKLNYMNYVGVDFSGSNFSNAEFKRCLLSYANLANTNLASAYFFGATMFHADLSHSNMQNVILRSTDLRFANLGGSDITNGDLRFSDISNANFCGANKTGVITNGIIYNVNTQCWP